MGNRNKICMLSPDEVELLKQNVAPSCCDHRHITKLEANEMTGRGDFKPYFIPIAVWVGPKHIRLLDLKAMRDKSVKLGEYLNKKVRQRVDWALAMESQMRTHHVKKTKTKLRRGPHEKMKTLEPGYIQGSKV